MALDAYYGFGLLQVIVLILWRVSSQEEHMNVQRDTVAQRLSSVASKGLSDYDILSSRFVVVSF